MTSFLRDTPRGVERGWMNDKYTAREKAHALHVLSGQVVLTKHPYDRAGVRSLRERFIAS